MREILFRGKREDNGKWVEGSYLLLNIGKKYICDGTVWIGTLNPCKNDIIPETVGQFTGLTDKNGQRIFEGDIIKYTVESYTDIYLVKWDIEAARFAAYGSFFKDDFPLGDFVYYDPKKCTVIGNVHDNPELIGGV